MTPNEIPTPRDPTDEEALALFKAVEELFPSKTLGKDKWYILTVRGPLMNTTRTHAVRMKADHGSSPR